MTDRTVYGISDAARRVGVAENTLRRYEADGFISPARTPTGQRIYFDQDIEKARAHLHRNQTRTQAEARGR